MMHRIQLHTTLWIVLALAASWVLPAVAAEPAQAADPDVSRGVAKEKVRVVIVDDDDEPKVHEEERIVVLDPEDLGDGRAYLGVAVEEETELEEGGARVTHVMPDSPAAEAGLQEGDVIVRFNGHAVHGPRGLTQRMRELAPGDEVEIEVIRDGRRQTLKAKLGERKGPRAFFWRGDGEDLDRVPFDAQKLEELREYLDELFREHDLPSLRGFRMMPGLGGPSRPRLGIQLMDLTPELRRHYGAPEDQGVLVAKVMDDMPAARAGVHVGDVIIAVNGEPVRDPGDLIRAIADQDGSVELTVVRNGSRTTIRVDLPPREEEDRLPSGPRA